MTDSDPYPRLLGDSRLLRRVRLENLMLVALGQRSCSQTTIPAELPSGELMGAAIDSEARPGLERVRSTADPQEKLKAIAALKKTMSEGFDRHVEGSEEYRALESWARELGLKVDQVEVRPTVHEFYLYRSGEVLKWLQRLTEERGRLRKEALKKPDPQRGELQLAYPEEFNPTWIRQMGRLLGYPDCCAARYAEDRAAGINAEQRAAAQLKEARGADPYAYFTAYFFPCSPTCTNAVATGNRYHEALSGALPKAGDLYEASIQENLERVRNQPEIIGEYLKKIRG